MLFIDPYLRMNSRARRPDHAHRGRPAAHTAARARGAPQPMQNSAEVPSRCHCIVSHAIFLTLPAGIVSARGGSAFGGTNSAPILLTPRRGIRQSSVFSICLVPGIVTNSAPVPPRDNCSVCLLYQGEPAFARPAFAARYTCASAVVPTPREVRTMADKTAGKPEY